MEKKRTIVIRNVNPFIYRQFKAKAVECDMTLGAAADAAMVQWAMTWNLRRKRFKRLKPVRWRADKSARIDAVLYR